MVDIFFAYTQFILVQEVYFIFAKLLTGELLLFGQLVEDCFEYWFFNFAMEVVKYIKQIVRSILFLHVFLDLRLSIATILFLPFAFFLSFALLLPLALLLLFPSLLLPLPLLRPLPFLY